MNEGKKGRKKATRKVAKGTKRTKAGGEGISAIRLDYHELLEMALERANEKGLGLREVITHLLIEWMRDEGLGPPPVEGESPKANPPTSPTSPTGVSGQ